MRPGPRPPKGRLLHLERHVTTPARNPNLPAMAATHFAPFLEPYLARIGCSVRLAPTLETLRALHLAHVRAVPFENVDVLLGRIIDIEPAAIAAKIIHGRRGGYCFEQNTLFREVLRETGFDVTPMLARVRRNVPAEVRTPLTHMVLQVVIDGRPWLADVGFGAVGPSMPLALDTTEEQETPHEPHRLVCRDGKILHQVKLSGEWMDVYVFVPEGQESIDFELGNWFSCTHPKAHFKNNLIVTRVGDGFRLSIFNREFTTRRDDGRVETSAIATPLQLLELLESKFELRFDAGTRIEIPAAPWDR